MSLVFTKFRFLGVLSFSSVTLAQRRGAMFVSDVGLIGLSGYLNVQAGWAPLQLEHLVSVAVHFCDR